MNKTHLIGALCAVVFGFIPFLSNAALIAVSDGSIPFTSAVYSSGLGNPGDTNYVDIAAITSLNTLGDTVIIELTMGGFTDYFKPVSGSNLSSMLGSSSQHLWSATVDGMFIAPVYNTNPANLGGSANNWPSDGRFSLPYWGSNNFGGGCCQSSLSGSPAWNQSFSIATIATPVPAAVWLFGSGLIGLVGIARKRKAT